jgi:uncharacterized membrane protein YfhO
MPVILAIAFFVVRWDAPIAAKWGVIALGSFVVSAALATTVARLPVLSTIFGVKGRARPVTEQSRSLLGTAHP